MVEGRIGRPARGQRRERRSPGWRQLWPSGSGPKSGCASGRWPQVDPRAGRARKLRERSAVTAGGQTSPPGSVGGGRS
eukprot:2002312-Pyramimonas_sp.AAC.1